MGFVSDKFKNLIEYKSGYTWSKDQESSTYQDGSVRVLTVTNIQEKLDLSSELFLTKVLDRDRERKAASKGWSIAVSSNGNRKRIGNAVFIEDDTDYLFASFLTGFTPKDQDVILPKYFFYWLSSHPIQERITSVSEGTTGLGNLDIRFLRNMNIDYPREISEQKAIVGILSKVDDAIEAVEKSIKAAEGLKKSLMQNLLTGLLKPDGTWRTEDDFYSDEKIGKVPKGWEVATVGLITDRKTTSFDPQKSGSVKKYIGLEHIEPGTFTRIGMGYSDETLSLKSEFSKGDVLLGKLRPYLNKVWIADIDGVCSTEFLVFPRNEFSVWLYLNFQSKRFLDYTTSMTAGTQHPRTSWRDVKRYKISYPVNQEERCQIEESIIAIEEERGKQLAKIHSLKNLKKSLMQNLLTGKVRLDVEKIKKLLEE